MKIIIAGGRDFTNYELLKHFVAECLLGIVGDIEIVSGGAKGVDELGELFAFEHKLKLTKFPADWNKYGKSAGPIRNAEMANYANMLIAFWDGQSKGTKNMIDCATKKGLVVKIVNYYEN